MRLFFVIPLAVLTPVALATTSANVSVSGIISPPSCDITVTGNGNFDYGEIFLAPTGNTNAPVALVLTMSVNCLGPSLDAFKSIDNRASTMPAVYTDGKRRYGLGVDSQINAIGMYGIRMTNVLVDSVPAWSKTQRRTVRHGGPHLETKTSSLISLLQISTLWMILTSAPKPSTNSSVDISAGYAIQPRNTLDTGSVITL